jgi:hypothetical protein
VTATGGLAALASHGAHVVPPGDPAALATAIITAITTPTTPCHDLGWAIVGPRLDAHWRR